MFKIIKTRVREIAQGINKYDYKKITTEGRRDSAGRKESNKKLSGRRCDGFIENGAKAG